MATKKTSKIGFDPLSWMHDDDFEALQESVATAREPGEKKSTQKAVAEPSAEQPISTAATPPKRRATARKRTPANRRRTARKKTAPNEGEKFELIAASFAALSQRTDELVTRFYEALFARYPEIKAQLQSVAIDLQKTELTTVLSQLINNFNKPDARVAALQAMGVQYQ